MSDVNPEATSNVILSGATSTVTGATYATHLRRNFTFSIDLSEAVTSGDATVKIEYLNANGQWQELDSVLIDNTGFTPALPSKIANMVASGMRARVSDYSSLAGSGGPVAITVSMEAA